MPASLYAKSIYAWMHVIVYKSPVSTLYTYKYVCQRIKSSVSFHTLPPKKKNQPKNPTSPPNPPSRPQPVTPSPTLSTIVPASWPRIPQRASLDFRFWERWWWIFFLEAMQGFFPGNLATTSPQTNYLASPFSPFWDGKVALSDPGPKAFVRDLQRN